MNTQVYATSNVIRCWQDINFNLAEKHIKKLQSRIAIAYQQGDNKRVTSLQHQLIHSFYAKALAVKIVTSNRGKYTVGVDNILWWTDEDKWNAIHFLSSRGYNPKPLKRTYIIKSNGKLRPLSIPTIKDRAMQTLYKFALEPIAEISADLHSYGFRKNLSTCNAGLRCSEVLSNNTNFKWILEADIQDCFSNIKHEWIIDHIPINKQVLEKFIKCGYVENNKYYSTDKGIPQGGCISPIICNMTLDGLENKLKDKFQSKIEFVRYADDFIVMSESKNLLIDEVVPLIEDFLSQRGLSLSVEKTKITHIKDGFDFLGWNLRMYDKHLIIVPSQRSIDYLFDNIEYVVTRYSIESPEERYKRLKPLILGWFNYHRKIVLEYSLYDIEFDIIYALREWTNDFRLTELIGKIF